MVIGVFGIDGGWVQLQLHLFHRIVAGRPYRALPLFDRWKYEVLMAKDMPAGYMGHGTRGA